MVRRTRTMSRNSQRSMRGGVEPPSSIFGPPSQPSSGLSVPPSQVAASDDSLSKTASDAYNSTKNAETSATSYLANTFTNLFPSTENKVELKTPPVLGTGGRRRRRRRFYGGNGNAVDNGVGSGNITPSMYKYGSDAAQVSDIQMAQPNTLVGGRRRRRRSSRSRGRSLRRSRRRSSRRN